MAVAASRMRTWYLLHRWSSLVCTLFLLLLCLTGLPLVFKDEIEDWLRETPAPVPAAAGTPRADLDAMVERARGTGGLFPGETVRWISLEDDRPEVWIALAPSYAADRRLNHVVRFHAHTGQVLEQRPSAAAARPTVMGVVFWLHKGLLAGLPGELVLGAMGLLFVLATVSGAVLYGPFMRRRAFGNVRRGRGPRIRWLDLHNLLGIGTLVWALVVGVTGVLNEVSEPAYGHWREAALAAMLRPHEGQPMPVHLASVQQAADTVAKALPGMQIRSVRYPDGELGSPHHYLVWAIGGSPLTSRLFQPALVDAATGALAGVAHVPWYLAAIQLSRPLHFGDYGGLPLKVLWVALDLAAIAVLGSGVYLWFARRKAGMARLSP